MIDARVLKPSEIERLMASELSDNDREAILSNIYRMMQELQDDNGAETDLVFLAAVKLTVARVWDHIGAMDTAHVLRDAEEGLRQAFLDGLPQSYAAIVSTKN